VELELDNRPFSILLTDADGRFTAAALPAGRYTLSAAKPGYVKTTLSTSIGTARRIDVVDGASVEGFDIQLPKAGAISGRIIDDTGEPIIGALVTADSFGDGGRTSGAGETDDLGVYRIGGLPQSRFIMAVALPPGQMRKMALVVGGMAPMIPAGGTASVSGAVINGPVSDLRPRLYYPGVAQASDAQPIEVLGGEERAAIDFGVPTSQLTNDVTLGGVRLQGNVAMMGVGPIGPVVGRPEDRDATAEIRGRIVRADGRPIARAQVRLDPLDTFRIGLGTLTDDSGAYEFVKLRASEYTLAASKPGYIDVEFGQRRASEHGEVIRLAAGEKRERADISLPRYGTITGRVLDENGDPVERARVQLLQIRFEAGRQRLVEARATTKQTDDLGHYRVHEIPPGQYVVQATVGQVDLQHVPFELPMADVPGYAPTYYPGTPKASEARLLAVGVSEDLVEMDFAMARVPTARLSGHAFTSSGDSVKGGVLLIPSERSGSVTMPIKPHRMFAPDGSFEFSNVPPGDYVIQASMGRPTLAAEGEFAAQYVTVNGTDIDDLLIRTSPGSTISGRVTFEGGEPPRPGEIGLTPVPVDPDLNPRFNDLTQFGAGPPGRAEVHDDWTFEIVGISGPRRLRLTSPPAGWALKAIYLNGADVTDQTFTFGRKDQALRDLQVVLTNQVTVIEGAVVDASGRMARDCVVIAFPAYREARSPYSRLLDHSVCERDGSFIIRRLPPGDYLIAAIGRRSDEVADEWQDPQVLDAIAPNAMRVTLTEGQKLATSLKLIAR
jgi:hypothetical protein